MHSHLQVFFKKKGPGLEKRQDLHILQAGSFSLKDLDFLERSFVKFCSKNVRLEPCSHLEEIERHCGQ
jgi:hypothetical protein